MTTIEHNPDNNNENCIEFLTNMRKISFTFTARKWINKVKKLKEEHPDEIDYVENPDGSIFGHAPIKYFKLSAPRKVELSEEQKVERAARMRSMRENRNGNK